MIDLFTYYRLFIKHYTFNLTYILIAKFLSYDTLLNEKATVTEMDCFVDILLDKDDGDIHLFPDSLKDIIHTLN